MKHTNEIKAVELVRKIRDGHAKKLANKTPSEIMEFFNRAGDRAKESLRTPKTRAAEIEGGSPTIMMEVPSALVPAIRRLIARRMSATAQKASGNTLRPPVRRRAKPKTQKTAGK